MRRVLVVGVSLLGSACFSYRAVPVTSIGTGTEVRITLTDAGTTSLTPAIGTYVSSLEGTIRSADPQAFTVALASVTRRGAGESRWNGELVTLGPSDIRDMELKHLSRSRSWTAASLFVAGGVAVITAIAKAKGHTDANGRPVTPGS